VRAGLLNPGNAAEKPDINLIDASVIAATLQELKLIGL